jgi:hypothetical protein
MQARPPPENVILPVKAINWLIVEQLEQLDAYEWE